MEKLFVTIASFILFTTVLSGQVNRLTDTLVRPSAAASGTETGVFPELVPPSPNASSLGVYGQIPVGCYTGIPDIEIPLYEIECGRIRVPISLSYHASGIRVSQEASWVGLGWALNAGGAITRSVYGGDDLNDYNYRGTDGYIAAEFPDHNDDEYLTGEDGTIAYGVPIYYQDYMQNRKDVRPDLFRYNFGGYSGEMVFPKKDVHAPSGVYPEPLILNQDQMTVNYSRDSDSDLGEWTVITPDGTCYHFATAELTKIYCDPWNPPVNPPNLLPQVYTAWYLDSITNPYGDKVEFIYRKNAALRSQPQGVWNKGYCENPYAAHIQDWHFSEKSYTAYVTDEILLEEIRFNGGKVLFGTEDRADLMYDGNIVPQALSSITVRNSEGETVREFTVHTDYYNKNHTSASMLRLRLDSVESSDGKVWTFGYSGTSLPDKNSIDIDYWGFYKGKISNSMYESNLTGVDIPIPHLVNTFLPNTSATLTLGVDRNAVETNAKVGILEKITYPTGGWTEFEYELHDFYNNDIGSLASDFKYSYDYYDRYTSEESLIEYEFEVKDAVPCRAEVTINYSGFRCTGGLEYPAIDYEHEDFTPGSTIWTLFRKNESGKWISISRKDFSTIKCREISGNEATQTVATSFEPGEYKIEIPTYSNTRAGIEMVIPHIKDNDELEGGGLRIKKITESDGKNISVREYLYENKSGLSTGIAFAYPRTIYLPAVMASGSYGQMSSNVFSLGAPMTGITVGYDFVSEIYRDNDSTAYIREYHYHNDSGGLERTSKVPNTPIEYHMENGLPEYTVTWDSRGNKIEETTYVYSQEKEQRKFVEGMNILSLYHPTDPNVSIFNFYEYPSEWWHLDEEKTVRYYPNGSVAAETKEYRYDTIHHKVISVKTVYGDGIELTDSSTYLYREMPGDVPYSVELPHKFERYAGDEFLEGVQYTYGSGLDLLQTLTKGSGQSGYEERLSIEEYDDFHNPVYMVKDGTEHIVYLWSYGGRYPVAEILNATYAEVCQALGRPDTFASDMAEAPSPDMALLDSLRTLLPDAHVSTYTYRPLVGMLTDTDPAGKTVTYEYDDSGRLVKISDNAGNPVQTFEYHYRDL